MLKTLFRLGSTCACGLQYVFHGGVFGCPHCDQPCGIRPSVCCKRCRNLAVKR